MGVCKAPGTNLYLCLRHHRLRFTEITMHHRFQFIVSIAVVLSNGGGGRGDFGLNAVAIYVNSLGQLPWHTKHQKWWAINCKCRAKVRFTQIKMVRQFLGVAAELSWINVLLKEAVPEIVRRKIERRKGSCIMLPCPLCFWLRVKWNKNYWS